MGVHPVLAALAGVRAAVAAAAEAPCWSPSDAEVVVAIGELLAARSGLEAVTAALVGQADARGVRCELLQTTTKGWLRRRFQLSSTEVGRLVTLAAALPRWGQVQDALTQGRVSAEAAAAITTVLTGLPDTATADELSRAEELLVTQAATLDPAELALCGRALREALTVTPDLDDPVEAEAVAKELATAEAAERGAWERRTLRLVRRRDGMLGITGSLDALSGAEVREVLEASARPADAVEGVPDDRNSGQRLVDALVEIVTSTGPLDLEEDAGMTTPDHEHPSAEDSHDHAEDDLDQVDDSDAGDIDREDLDSDDLGDIGDPMLDFGDGFDPEATDYPVIDSPGARHDHDTRHDDDSECAGTNRAHRRAHRCGTDQRTGRGKRPGRKQPPTARPGVTVSLIVDWDRLRAGLAGGTLPDGTTLSPAASLAALCDAGIIPMIFNGPGQPLHVGRARREFTPAQRRALAARDHGCTFPGCHRRASVTAAHHLVHWENGGPTDISNGALLCRYHHQLVHREGWEGRLDARGRPEYRPPAAIDPERRPRQHLRFATAA